MAIAQRPLKARVIPPAAIRYVGTAKLQSAWYWKNVIEVCIDHVMHLSYSIIVKKMPYIRLLELTDAPIATFTIAIMTTIKTHPLACQSAIFFYSKAIMKLSKSIWKYTLVPQIRNNNLSKTRRNL